MRVHSAIVRGVAAGLLAAACAIAAPALAGAHPRVTSPKAPPYPGPTSSTILTTTTSTIVIPPISTSTSFSIPPVSLTTSTTLPAQVFPPLVGGQVPTEGPAGPGVGAGAGPTNAVDLNLPTIYSELTTEGTQVCGYLPGAALGVSIDGQAVSSATVRSDGCTTIRLNYIGNTDFTYNQGPTMTLHTGTNQVVLAGTARDGSQLTTNVHFKLANNSLTGNKHGPSGKGIPVLALWIVAALVAAGLLAAGTVMYYLSQEKVPAGADERPLLGGKDDEEGEEGSAESGTDRGEGTDATGSKTDAGSPNTGDKPPSPTSPDKPSPPSSRDK